MNPANVIFKNARLMYSDHEFDAEPFHVMVTYCEQKVVEAFHVPAELLGEQPITPEDWERRSI